MRWRMSRSCNSTGNGRFMGVEHGFKALSQPFPGIMSKFDILVALMAQLRQHNKHLTAEKCLYIDLAVIQLA